VCVPGRDANELLNLLVDHGADVNAADRIGQTPLMQAAELRRSDLIRSLIRAGAGVNCRARNSWTALHWAFFCYDSDSVNLLLQAGADPNAADDTGLTPSQVFSRVAVSTQPSNH